VQRQPSLDVGREPTNDLRMTRVKVDVLQQWAREATLEVDIVADPRTEDPSVGDEVDLLRHLATSVEKAVAQGVLDELGTPMQIELRHDPRPVGVHRLRADEESLGDLEVRESARREPQHLALAR
jgi:hypothetical protein